MDYDLLIIGGGIAGLCAAIEAPTGARVAVLDKGEAGAGSSPLAQGGIAAAVDPTDDAALHAKDTTAAGAGICDEDVVDDLCRAGPGAIAWLIDHGCDFDRNPDGSIHLAREGGQSVGRSVHWRDATGAEIVRALRKAVAGRAVERIKARADGLLVQDGRCVGVHAHGQVFTARSVLLATGGAGALWAATTNAPGATADGIALAMAAGAQLADLEFMQFHPTALAIGDAQRPLLTEALRGHGALLINDSGERFVDELAPRHVVAKAIIDQGKSYLDCRAIADLAVLFPTVVAAARAHGFDPISEPMPVEPAAHYFIGGVAADAYGRTSIPGLFAAGECAATGLHGANRMAGNSLLETVVVGRRVGALSVDAAAVTVEGSLPPPILEAGATTDLPRIMWRGVGAIRSDDLLAQALGDLALQPPSRHRDLCVMIARAARARAETRGVHIRTDFPDPEPAYAVRSFQRAPR